MQGLTEGRSEAWIVDRIKNIAEGLTGYRARRISRDQIGKLNSLITKEQSLSLGMTQFFWHTTGDELVRGSPGRYRNAVPSHYMMDNLLCSWTDNTVYSDDKGKTWKPKTAIMEMENPGIAICCRCSAYIIFPYIYDIDKELGDDI